MAKKGAAGTTVPKPPLNKRTFHIPADVRALKEYGHEIINNIRQSIRAQNGG